MGVRNYWIDGLSGAGKTTVAEELQRRGHHVIHGDRPVDRVKSLLADQSNAMSFFCGGTRNAQRFVEMFDAVFFLDVDVDTLNRRLADRPQDVFGAKPVERDLVARLHAAGEGIPPNAVRIDATRPVEGVVDAILSRCSTVG